MTGRDAVRDQLAAALPHFPWCDEDGAVDDSGFPCVCQPERERLAEYALPVVDRIANERAAAELEAARQYARQATRTGLTEGRGQEYTRHWAATAGWLKHRREALLAGREPDWPDAAYNDALSDHLDPS